MRNPLVMQGGETMLKQARNQKGFTLIELMIVVAIIGILAAIAIPNFLQYQMKSRQTEARTNLSGIKTSELAFNGERGCFLATTLWPSTAPAAGTKTQSQTWVLGPAPAGIGTFFCTAPPGAGGAPVGLGTFTDLGYASTGNLLYRYAVDTLNTPGGVTPMIPGSGACSSAGATGANTGAVNNGFIATASSNLDGDGTISTFGVSDAAGAMECTQAGTF
jgi:type IV pilus assembly protein PilA